MKDIDAKLRETLRDRFGDDALADDTGNSLIRDALAAFRGRSLVINIGTTLATIAFLVAGVWMTIEMFRTADVRRAVMLGTGILFCMLAVTALKIWFWMEMERNSILREIKRIELLIARTAR